MFSSEKKLNMQIFLKNSIINLLKDTLEVLKNLWAKVQCGTIQSERILRNHEASERVAKKAPGVTLEMPKVKNDWPFSLHVFGYEQLS